MPDLAARVRDRIRDVPDFPQPGILFKDITPVLADAQMLESIVIRLAEEFGADDVAAVAGIESRGFILGAPLALALGVGFVPIRKPGKLPWRTARVDYALEYGSDSLEAHLDSVAEGQRILIVDDVLATGGTAAGAIQLIRQLGGEVSAVAVLVELGFLNGREKLDGTRFFSLIEL